MPLTIDPLARDVAIVEMNTTQHSDWANGSLLEDVISDFDAKLTKGAEILDGNPSIEAFYLVIRLTRAEDAEDYDDTEEEDDEGADDVETDNDTPDQKAS